MSEIVICLLAYSGFDKAAQGLTGEGRRLADRMRRKTVRRPGGRWS